MTSPRQKFQELLRKLFQFDSAELDFGIYRIMNHKRAVIEHFIEKDLLDAVTQELAAGALAQQSTLADRLAKTIEQIKDKLGSEALDAEGTLDPIYEKTPLGKEYLKLYASAASAKNRPELEAEIFNHLYAFFSRYYDEGDFMSLRRYSKREKYVIPYNGEEVFLHWANSDQYYIKTGESFTDYSYTHGNWKVRFNLRNADVEQNNVNGAKRFFVPRLADVAVDDDRREVTIPFEFRPLTSDEETRLGKTKIQEAILMEGVPNIIESAKANTDALSALAHEKRRDADGNPVSMLEHHIRLYATKNTTDFFIHKDLKGFLDRELDFYLKNEVLNLDELEASGESRSEAWFQMLRTIKGIGRTIIAFVSQIEDFQKRLFEKKKFIAEVNYCVTLESVPRELYAEVAGNAAQREAWVRLFAIDEIEKDLTAPGYSAPLTVEFLNSNPYLVVDTQFFTADFKEKLIASICSTGSLDETISGVLVHSENFQALRLLSNRYRGDVDCIHIDPPYNTQTSGFLYKNSYQHSSWLAMMAQVTEESLTLLKDEGAYLCHIDENEYEHLKILFDLTGPANAGTVVWDKRNPMLGGVGIATQHEYVIWRTSRTGPVFLKNGTLGLILDTARDLVQEHGGVNVASRTAFSKWLASYPGLTGGERAYKFLDDDGRIYQSVALGAPEKRTDPKFHRPLLHPRTKKPCPVPPNGWSRTPDTLQKLIKDDEIIFGDDEKVQPRRKVFLTPESQRQIPSVIQDANRGKSDMERLGLEFAYNHPVSLYDVLVGSAIPGRIGILLDFFAGSGTNGHAAISLNREDNGRRKYLLVEVGEQFDSVLKPRIEKVIYAGEWKDGKPQSRTGGVAQLVKYFRLESYEDALDNIAFEQADESLLKMGDYVLSYMLDFETKDSATLLNVAQLDSPFDYKLYRHGKDDPLPVDLPETFNYLIGLHVKTRKVYENKGVRYLIYRRKSDDHETVVIWRTTRGWGKEEFDADRAFIAKQKITDGAEDVFVNTDSFVPDARSLDPVFKRRMFNEE